MLPEMAQRMYDLIDSSPSLINAREHGAVVRGKHKTAIDGTITEGPFAGARYSAQKHSSGSSSSSSQKRDRESRGGGGKAETNAGNPNPKPKRKRNNLVYPRNKKTVHRIIVEEIRRRRRNRRRKLRKGGRVNGKERWVGRTTMANRPRKARRRAETATIAVTTLTHTHHLGYPKFWNTQLEG